MDRSYWSHAGTTNYIVSVLLLADFALNSRRKRDKQRERERERHRPTLTLQINTQSVYRYSIPGNDLSGYHTNRSH